MTHEAGDARKVVPRDADAAMFIAGTKALAAAEGSLARVVWQAMYDAAPAQAEPRRWCIWDDCGDDAIYCEGHAREAFGPREPHCPVCGTHEVSMKRTCHNSACPEYAMEATVYEGWRKPDAAPAAQDGPATLLAKMRRLRDALAALEGEEIAYGDAMHLAGTMRVVNSILQAYEADHD